VGDTSSEEILRFAIGGAILFQSRKIIAIIPARGGSKGVINKNIVDVCGKPLIEYTIDAAKMCRYIDRIYVSTDSNSIAKISEKCGISVPELRPSHLATDDSKTIDTLKYTLQLLKRESYDYVVLLQPTQPLRTTTHINEAIELIVPGHQESIVSVTEVTEHPIFMRRMDSTGRLKSLLNISSTVRRQDLEKYYKVNGAIYINKVEDILKQDISLNDNKIPYVMEKRFDLDIDTKEDLEKFIRIQFEKGGERNEDISFS